MKASELLQQQHVTAQASRTQAAAARLAFEQVRNGLMAMREYFEMAHRRVLPLNYSDPGVIERIETIWSTIESTSEVFGTIEEGLRQIGQRLILIEQLCAVPIEGEKNG